MSTFLLQVQFHQTQGAEQQEEQLQQEEGTATSRVHRQENTGVQPRTLRSGRGCQGNDKHAYREAQRTAKTL